MVPVSSEKQEIHCAEGSTSPLLASGKTIKYQHIQKITTEIGWKKSYMGD
jgi:hypothetical protein